MFTVVPNIVSVEMGVFLDYKLYFFSRTIYSNRLSSMIDFGWFVALWDYRIFPCF